MIIQNSYEKEWNCEQYIDNVQPAVKKETKRSKITAVGLILMWILFAVLHFTMPDKVPLDYTVFLGGIGGGAVAVLNFFPDGAGSTEGCISF